jgi:hypothetical protein
MAPPPPSTTLLAHHESMLETRALDKSIKEASKNQITNTVENNTELVNRDNNCQKNDSQEFWESENNINLREVSAVIVG